MASVHMEEEKGLDYEDEKQVRFVLKYDGAPFHSILFQSACLSQMVEGAVSMSTDDEFTIPLDPSQFSTNKEKRVYPKTAELTLSYVIQYLELVREETIAKKIKKDDKAEKKTMKPLISTNLVENGFSQKEADWIDKVYSTKRPDGSPIGKRTLFNLILAANYMAILPLVELCAAKIAASVKGQGLENYQNLLTPEPYTEDD